MELVNGSEVLFRSTDDPEHLRGPNMGAVWMDEAAYSEEAAFDTLVGGIRAPGFPNQIWLTTTPRGYNWVYGAFVKGAREGYGLHHWTTRDNPYVTREYIARMVEKYGPEQALQEIEGRFVMISGRSQFDQGWLRELLGRTGKVEESSEAGTRVRLWAPRLEWHQYVLGIDPKGQGKDRGYGMLLDWTVGDLMGEIRCENPDPAVLRAACVKMALAYDALCVPETNGVGHEYARRMLDAGCRVFRRPLREGEKLESEAYRVRPYGWNTDVLTRPLILGALQEGLRSHRLGTANQEFVHAAGAWDPEEEPHLPDILSAAGIACAAGSLLWGEMGSTVRGASHRAMKHRPRLAARLTHTAPGHVWTF